MAARSRTKELRRHVAQRADPKRVLIAATRRLRLFLPLQQQRLGEAEIAHLGLRQPPHKRDQHVGAASTGEEATD